jgi:hypothetical protein
MTPEYVHDEAAQIAEDRQRLDKACVDIPRMEDQLDLLMRSLDGARRLRDVLTESLPLRMRALQLLCADGEWDLPTFPPPDKPTPIADGISRETTGTLAFEAVKAAKPSSQDGGATVCAHSDCGMELVHVNNVWLHANTGLAMCKPKPAVQEGMGGDPTKRTALPPHIAAEVRTDG